MSDHTHHSDALCREPRSCRWDSPAWRLPLLSEAGTGSCNGSGLACKIIPCLHPSCPTVAHSPYMLACALSLSLSLSHMFIFLCSFLFSGVPWAAEAGFWFHSCWAHSPVCLARGLGSLWTSSPLTEACWLPSLSADPSLAVGKGYFSYVVECGRGGTAGR